MPLHEMYQHIYSVCSEGLSKNQTSPGVLALPDLDKTFVIETDASNCDIRAVLMQDEHPLAFLSKTLGPRRQKLSVYEKELLAVVSAVQRWEQYLSGQQFIIKTDQKSLKWSLQQNISMPLQQLWLSKLMGFNYQIQYKSGQENLAADALSRVTGAEIMFMALSVLDSNLSKLIQESYTLDINLIQLTLQKLKQGQQIHHFSWSEGLIRRRRRSLRKEMRVLFNYASP